MRNEKLLGKIDEDIVNLRGLVGQSMEGLKETIKEMFLFLMKSWFVVPIKF